MSYEDRLRTKRYLVTGKRKYRWHDPGTTFEAQLDPDAERRAIERGSIRVLEVIEVQVGRYELPEDWPQDAADAQQPESPAGVSRVN
jgi:hypothetical protein